MKLKNYAYRCVAVVCAIVAVACVDEEFSFDKVSKEISVIDGETILPLGSLDKQTLGSLLGSDTELPEGFVKNSDGSYVFTYLLPSEPITAPNFELPTEFEIGAMETSFEIDLPTLDFSTYGTKVEESFDLDLDVEFLNTVMLLFATDDSCTIPAEEFDRYIPEDKRNFALEIEEEVEIDPIEFELPDQIKNISRILFDGEGENVEGAPLSVQLDLNSFAGINAGGHLNFTLKSKADLVTVRRLNHSLRASIMSTLLITSLMRVLRMLASQSILLPSRMRRLRIRAYLSTQVWSLISTLR